MAIVQLKDVKVYATFAKGFRVVEESKGRDGKDYSTRWTVWCDTLGVREGDVVSLSGFLSAKVNDWTDKDQVERHAVELALNSPRLANREGASAPDSEPWADTTPTGSTSQSDVWNQPRVDDLDTPF
jgi:hypothetical protein